MRELLSRNQLAIKRNFNRAAATYDQAADLQRQVANELISLHTNAIKNIQNTEKYILDLGSGTGYLTQLIKKSLSNTKLIATDLAEQMLLASQLSNPNTQHICSNAEQLCFADQQFDLIFSSLTLQWCLQPEKVINELFRILKPGGQLLFSTLGPSSLKEIRHIYSHIDKSAINNFMSKEILLEYCEKIGFEKIKINQNTILNSFSNIISAIKNLKKIGAHHPTYHNHHNKSKKFLGKDNLIKFKKNNTPFETTYDVLYFCMSKPK